MCFRFPVRFPYKQFINSRNFYTSKSVSSIFKPSGDDIVSQIAQKELNKDLSNHSCSHNNSHIITPNKVGVGAFHSSPVAHGPFRNDLDNKRMKSFRNIQKDTSDYEKIIENNRNWVARKNEKDPNFFKNQNVEHTPNYLWIGCSDARVPAENLTGLNDGEIFVHRNIANLVVNTDINMLSVLTYAVEFLKVKHIIVCGHYGCGGVKAAISKDMDLGVIEHWLRNVRDVNRLHLTELSSIVDDEVRYRRLIELNVVEQCINLFKTGVVQESRLSTGYPIIHGLVYDIDDGLLKELQLDLFGYMSQYKSVYKLFKDEGPVPESE